MSHKPRRATAAQRAEKVAKAKSRKAREQFDDTPDGVAARIEAEIQAEEQARIAKRRASGQRWAPVIEPLFFLAVLFTAITLCAWGKLPQGRAALSLVSAVLGFVAAYGIHRASVVVHRFPVKWFGRGVLTGTLVSIGIGVLGLVLCGLAVHDQFFD